MKTVQVTVMSIVIAQLHNQLNAQLLGLVTMLNTTYLKPSLTMILMVTVLSTQLTILMKNISLCTSLNVTKTSMET